MLVEKFLKVTAAAARFLESLVIHRETFGEVFLKAGICPPVELRATWGLDLISLDTAEFLKVLCLFENLFVNLVAVDWWIAVLGE